MHSTSEDTSLELARPLEALGGTNDEKHFIEIWNTATGDKVRRLVEFQEVVTAMALRRDGTLLATSDPLEQFFSREDKEKRYPVVMQSQLRVWDLDKGDLISSRKCAPVHTLIFSHDGRRLFAGHADTTIMAWDVKANPPK